MAYGISVILIFIDEFNMLTESKGIEGIWYAQFDIELEFHLSYITYSDKL